MKIAVRSYNYVIWWWKRHMYATYLPDLLTLIFGSVGSTSVRVIRMTLYDYVRLSHQNDVYRTTKRKEHCVLVVLQSIIGLLNPCHFVPRLLAHRTYKTIFYHWLLSACILAQLRNTADIHACGNLSEKNQQDQWSIFLWIDRRLKKICQIEHIWVRHFAKVHKIGNRQTLVYFKQRPSRTYCNAMYTFTISLLSMRSPEIMQDVHAPDPRKIHW